MARMINESGNAVTVSFDGSPIRPSRIPTEFKFVMTQEMKEWKKLLKETMFEYHRSQ